MYSIFDNCALGPCINVFINFDPYTTLDLFHPKKLDDFNLINNLFTYIALI